MPVTNANKKAVDLPFFEMLNSAPIASGAVAALTSAEDGVDRFVYYLNSSTLYRYDTYADTWQQLAGTPAGPTNAASLRYTKRRGTHGRVISATSSTVQIPGLRSGVLNGSEIEILHGTGAGQRRTITLSSETIHDSGVVTGTSVTALTDTTKKWKVNQWAGYLVGISFGTGPTQYRKILYNDATNLFVSDTNLMPQDPWNASAVFVATSPYVAPASTAGAQSHYVICSQTFTLNSNWTVTPDATSYYTTRTGGIYLLSSASTAPFFTLQYYDVAQDSWISKTVHQSLIGAALGTDFTIERGSQSGSALVTKVGAVSGAARTLTDAGLALTFDRYANYRLLITGGTGVGQNRRIVGNTATTFTVNKPWATTPDSTTTYEVWPDYDRVWMTGNGAAAVFAYSPETDWWMQGQHFDDGYANNVAFSYGSYVPGGITSGTYIASGVRAVNATPTAGGTGYVVGDVLTCSVGGTGAQVIVTSVSPGGIVTGIELYHAGTATGFTVGTGKATTGGSGTGCTIEITTVGAVGLISTAASHFLRRNDVVTFSGCSEAAWNAAHTVLCAPSYTQFCVAITATASMAASNSQSTTVVVDSSKNWTPGEHVGRLVHLSVAGTAPTSQIRWITANTATTLTVASITAASNGLSKYAIYDAKAFGADVQRRPEAELSSGYATGGSTTTLVDSTKNWVVNQWAGYLFKVEAGTGFASGRISIISNTATTLTFSAQAFTPDATTKYEIADSWGLTSAGSTTTLTESTSKNWTANQWAGKRVRLTGGTGTGLEYAITSSTNNQLTFALSTAPDTTTPYCILGAAPRSTGIELIYVWGGSDATKKGRYMYCARGGATPYIDIFDVTTGRWTYNQPFSPQSVTFSTGTWYAYDGVDTLYIGVGVGSSIARIYALNVNTAKIVAMGQTVQLGGNVHIGNFMEVLSSPDGVQYLYVLGNTSTAMSRAMVF